MTTRYLIALLPLVALLLGAPVWAICLASGLAVYAMSWPARRREED